VFNQHCHSLKIDSTIFVAKLSIVEEEADESLYWLRLLESMRFATSETSLALKVEANEILSIVVASKKTARKRGI
jgi:four helix bundle protein